jgi:hypothetical protein
MLSTEEIRHVKGRACVRSCADGGTGPNHQISSRIPQSIVSGDAKEEISISNPTASVSGDAAACDDERGLANRFRRGEIYYSPGTWRAPAGKKYHFSTGRLVLRVETRLREQTSLIVESTNKKKQIICQIGLLRCQI